MSRAAPFVLLTLVLGLAGCSGVGSDGTAAMRETAQKLGEIRSGTLDLRLVVTPRDAEDEPFGFEISGPFQLAERGALPVLDVEYTQIANGEEATVGIVSTGERAWARAGDELRELTAAELEDLRETGGGADAFDLPIRGWVDDPEVSGGGEVGGAETDKVEGELDVVAAANGLIQLVGSLGRDLPRIEGDDAERLRDAAEETKFELYTGQDDRLLRRLLMEARFGLDVPEDLRAALGDVVGATITFELGISDPNEPVSVDDPT